MDRRSLWAAGLTGLVLGLGLCGLLLYLSTATYGATTVAPLDPNVPANSEAVARGAGRIREIRSVLRDIYGLASNQTYLSSAMLISTDGSVTFLQSVTFNGVVSFTSGFSTPSLTSTGPIVFQTPQVVIGSLYSSLLLSITGPGAATPMLVLQSNYAGTAPPPVGASFANTGVFAFAVGVDFSVATPLPALFSYNMSLSKNADMVSAFFATPASSGNYVVLTRSGNDPNCIGLVSNTKGTTAFTIHPRKPSDNTSCISTVFWDIAVIGR